MGGEEWLVNATSGRLHPGNRPGTYCTRRPDGPPGPVWRVRKVSPPPGFDPWTVPSPST